MGHHRHKSDVGSVHMELAQDDGRGLRQGPRVGGGGATPPPPITQTHTRAHTHHAHTRLPAHVVNLFFWRSIGWTAFFGGTNAHVTTTTTVIIIIIIIATRNFFSPFAHCKKFAHFQSHHNTLMSTVFGWNARTPRTTRSSITGTNGLNLLPSDIWLFFGFNCKTEPRF